MSKILHICGRRTLTWSRNEASAEGAKAEDAKEDAAEDAEKC